MHEHFKRRHKEHCRICHKHFKNEDELSTHFYNEHESKRRKPYLSCTLCNGDWMASWKGTFKKHFEKIHKDR